MQLSRTKFRKSFILSTKKWIKCLLGKNPVNSRGKSGDITEKTAKVLEKINTIIGISRCSQLSNLQLKSAFCCCCCCRWQSKHLSSCRQMLAGASVIHCCDQISAAAVSFVLSPCISLHASWANCILSRTDRSGLLIMHDCKTVASVAGSEVLSGWILRSCRFAMQGPQFQDCCPLTLWPYLAGLHWANSYELQLANSENNNI